MKEALLALQCEVLITKAVFKGQPVTYDTALDIISELGAGIAKERDVEKLYQDIDKYRLELIFNGVPDVRRMAVTKGFLGLGATMEHARRVADSQENWSDDRLLTMVEQSEYNKGAVPELIRRYKLTNAKPKSRY
jgi:hypothetical protein